MKVAFVVLGAATAAKLSDYNQGAHFDKCISVEDFEGKTVSDDVTLTDRDADGCCAKDTLPGVWLDTGSPGYQGAQIVCHGSGAQYKAKGDGKCNYGKCFVYHQNLPCGDGARQHLNGCCKAHQGGWDKQGFADTCLGYEKKVTLAGGETVEYCTTYYKNYGKVGNMGTADGDDDIVDDVMHINCLNEYAACCGHMERNGKCDGDDAQYMAKTNDKLTEDACEGGVSAGGGAAGGGGSGAGTTNGTAADGAMVSCLGGGAALLAASAVM
jgi:hypothetical protein